MSRKNGSEGVGSGGVLLMFHCATNTGYAIGRLERVFHESVRLAFPSSQCAYTYSSLRGGHPSHLVTGECEVVECQYTAGSPESFFALRRLLSSGAYRTALAFDMPLRAAVLSELRSRGIKKIISYWGAPISGVYPPILRPLRKLQYLLARSRPDHFIFESKGMLDGALRGAMIPAQQTSVVSLGVDTGRFRPDKLDRSAIYRRFSIPTDRKILFFSGHMERRKGVPVLLEVMKELVDERRRKDVHLVLVGSTEAHMHELSPILSGTAALGHVTFGGYQEDIDLLMRGVDIGVIASTGWDSFTMSAVELAATAVPLLVSDLPGLREAVDHGVTGLVIPPGEVFAWADAIERLLNDPQARERFGNAGRIRALDQFSEERQIDRLAEILKREGEA